MWQGGGGAVFWQRVRPQRWGQLEGPGGGVLTRASWRASLVLTGRSAAAGEEAEQQPAGSHIQSAGQPWATPV